MATQSTNSLPNDFYNASTFYTLSGTAGAVWLFCLVLANLDPEGALLTPKYFRFIALALSLIIAAIMLIRQKMKKKLEDWLFAFFNGLLIFINASGLNAISSTLTFENVDSIKERSVNAESVQESSTLSLFNIPFFKNQPSWWIDEDYYLENRTLKAENDSLRQQVNALNNSSENLGTLNKRLTEALNSLKSCNTEVKKLKRELGSKNMQIDSKEEQIKELKKEITGLKNQIIRLRRQIKLLKDQLKQGPKID